MILAKTCYLHTGKLGVKQHFFSCTQIKNTPHVAVFEWRGGRKVLTTACCNNYALQDAGRSSSLHL